MYPYLSLQTRVELHLNDFIYVLEVELFIMTIGNVVRRNRKWNIQKAGYSEG